MAQYAHAQVIFEATSGLPEDDMVNNYHFKATDTPPDWSSFADWIADWVEDLVTWTPPAGNPMTHFLSAKVISGNVLIKIYDLTAPSPRYPIRERSFFFTPSGSGEPLPTETALVVSFQGERTAGTPQARRRNRVYLGGLRDNANVDSRPSSSCRNTVIAIYQHALDEARAAVFYHWVAFSPTIYSIDGSAEDACTDVDNGWVDDAWDTQRRRGLAPTTRGTFT